MTELTFPDILRIRPGATLTIKYDDVYGKNTPTIERLERLQKKYPKAEIFWYTGVDSVVPRKRFDGKCEIEGKWIRGNELFKKWKFIVFPRVGYKMPTNLPSNFQIINIKLPNVASSQIRKLIANGKPFEHLVTAGVAEYIKRYKLYQGGG
jgi:nicotinate-nucleotide adenylyltransferase